MAKPTADECAIAQRGADRDPRRRLRQGLADGRAASPRCRWPPHSKVINPADVAGYTDDEADNLRGKAAADWRWCPGMAAFVGGLGWSAMGGDEAIAVHRPGPARR